METLLIILKILGILILLLACCLPFILDKRNLKQTVNNIRSLSDDELICLLKQSKGWYPTAMSSIEEIAAVEELKKEAARRNLSDDPWNWDDTLGENDPWDWDDDDFEQRSNSKQLKKAENRRRLVDADAVKGRIEGKQHSISELSEAKDKFVSKDKFKSKSKREKREENEAYRLFGLSFETLTPDSLKQAYRRLMLKYHPDRNKNVDPEMLQKIRRYCMYLKSELRRKAA